MDNLHPLHGDIKGYRPQDKEMTSEPNLSESDGVLEYDSLKLYYLERLIKDCQGKTQLIFSASPLYKQTKEDNLDMIKTICDKYEIPLINHYTDTAFNNKRNYFYDRVHLNRRGATAYTKVVAGEIKRILEQNNQ
ncbi:MAG: hypothetical protein LUC91_01495 [Prevotella sp.]|nr:hypothetical protein [Prevotella sp.]